MTSPKGSQPDPDVGIAFPQVARPMLEHVRIKEIAKGRVGSDGDSSHGFSQPRKAPGFVANALTGVSRPNTAEERNAA